MYVDEESGEEMTIWLPPTPPSDDKEDYYVDVILEMAYDTHTTIPPAVLASIAPFSEEDYDVFGLSRRISEPAPTKKTTKSTTKHAKEHSHVNVPPSLFWRRLAADTLSTKLKKLATHQRKLKLKEHGQFTPLLEQQPEGPEWTIYEDWLLLKGITDVLEFPISLTISVPAQIPNWTVVADITSSLSRVRRSALQCREHLMNVVIPREDHTVKVDELEPRKHKTKDSSVKKTKRRDQRTKNLVVHNNIKDQSEQYTTSFEWVLQAGIKRKQTPKFIWDSVQKASMHNDLLKDYGVQIDNVQSPMHIAQQRAERVQSEHPRHSQVHQLLAQPYMGRGYHAGAQYLKSNVTELAKVGYNLPRQGSVPVSGTTQRFQASANPTFPASKLVASVPQSTLGHPLTSQVPPTSTVTSHATSLAASIGKSYNVSTGVSDLSKTLIKGGLTHQQLLLLRQTATIQQQQQHQSSTLPAQITQVGQQHHTAQTPQAQAAVIHQKLALPPGGIDQLRASVASVLPLQNRFIGIAATAASNVSSGTSALRGITTSSGRTLQTEEVLALLRQQSLRMAKAAGHVGQFQPTTSGTAQIQFRPDALQLTAKPQQSSVALQADTVKLVATPGNTSDGIQLKVEMTDLPASTVTATVASQQQLLVSQHATPYQQSTLAAQARTSGSSTITTTAQQSLTAHIQALAAQQKVALALQQQTRQAQQSTTSAEKLKSNSEPGTKNT